MTGSSDTADDRSSLKKLLPDCKLFLKVVSCGNYLR